MPKTDAISEAPAIAAAPRADSRQKINVVLFSGGSGTRTITETLLRHPQIELTILINCYDDGHSTGRLRRFIPGMLGPSDVRKNVNRLMQTAERSQRALQAISDFRLPVGIPRGTALRQIDAILDGKPDALPAELQKTLPDLLCWQAARLKSLLAAFRSYFDQQERGGSSFDFTDCALGNLFFAGCYLQQNRDFNATIDAFCALYEIRPGTLLNITRGENLFLVAEKENGSVLLNEADIVKLQDSSKISDLYLIDEQTYLRRVENSPEPDGGWGAVLRAGYCTPGMNPRAAAALASAQVIIYGPGTQHSSLLPSYLTEGVGEAIAANRDADKVFIGNIHRDFDIQTDDAGDLARKLLKAMNRNGHASVGWLDVVSHFFVQDVGQNAMNQGKYVPFDKTRFEFPLETVRVRDWEAQEGRHAGGYVLDELRQIVQSRIDVELAQVNHMVSIVVPVLNEEATVEEVLRTISMLDFQELGLSKEVLLIDGGSTDRTAELARKVRGVRVYNLPSGRGRGAAMRLGIEKARGNLLVFFPGDDEYRAEDIKVVVRNLLHSDFRAVFGTRAMMRSELSSRLKMVYENRRGLYLTSKYGGMLLSITALLLYNRYVSDVLTSLKGYDLPLLRSLQLSCDGIDLETEIVAKLARRHEYVLEVPVEYKPRTRSAGKKIRVADGISAILTLLRLRARPKP